MFDCGSYEENIDLIDRDYMEEVRKELTGKLARLKELISEKECLLKKVNILCDKTGGWADADVRSFGALQERTQR